MQTYPFTEQEVNILREGLLSLMENTGKAFYLVHDEATKKSINEEWTSYKKLLDRLCGE